MPEVGAATQARLPEIANPRISRLFREAERLWDARPDLQVRMPDIRPWEFWFWFSWFGAREHPEVAPLHYPLPPPDLIHRVVGSRTTTSQTFQDGGVWEWRRIFLSFLEAGFDLGRGGRVLDFGCGCGRILRHFTRFAHACQFVGADVDEDAIAWCRNNLDFASFEVLAKQPPSPFADGSFDAVLVFSVFSHLPDALHRRWMEDLFRITKPGAIVVVTVMGMRCIEKMIARNWPDDTPSADVLRRDLPRFQETGFAFYRYRQPDPGNESNRRFFERWDLEQYGVTFMLHKFFHPRWTDLFHVVSWNPAPDDWQDYVILRRLP